MRKNILFKILKIEFNWCLGRWRIKVFFRVVGEARESWSVVSGCNIKFTLKVLRMKTVYNVVMGFMRLKAGKIGELNFAIKHEVKNFKFHDSNGASRPALRSFLN